MKSPHRDSLALIFASLLGASAAFGCTKSFDGAKFLQAAASRGLVLQSPEKCVTAELQSNTFYAPPGADCRLVMPNGGWLGTGFSFQSIQGSGRFETELKTEGIHIKVPAGGGMKFNQVAIAAPNPTCTSLALDDVFISATQVTAPPPPPPPLKEDPPTEDKPKVPSPATD